MVGGQGSVEAETEVGVDSGEAAPAHPGCQVVRALAAGFVDLEAHGSTGGKIQATAAGKAGATAGDIPQGGVHGTGTRSNQTH